MNLANLGLSGILAAQNRLQTAGHNINNADTAGFNRQTVLVQTAGAANMGSGYIGRGVQAVTVQRAYDSFMFRQLVQAQSDGASLVAYGNEITQINNLFADPTVGVSPALQKFFDGMQAVASSPADSAARQELLGRASSLVGQLNDANRFLDDQRSNINTQITTVVTQINSYAERVLDLNRQITVARATSEHEPNDLLDQRDQLFSELTQLVDVRASEQDGNFNLIMGNGQVLLGGNSVYPLQTVPSADDPSRMSVAYTVQSPSGGRSTIEMDDHRITGGSLGGLLTYRREALESVQNDLGRLAVGLAMSFNEIHAKGADLNGNPGGQFFTLGGVKVMPSASNASSGATLDVEYTELGFDSNGKLKPSQLTGQDYQIEYNGTNYVATRIPDGTTAVLDVDGTGSAELDGLTFTLPVASTAGDSWLIQPTRAAASDISVNITDPAHIAAAAGATQDTDAAGRSNGDNALDLAALQSIKVMANGAMSLNEGFSQIVNKVGVLTQQNGTAAKAQNSLIQQNYSAQQALSGVNLDEEYMNLDRYQQQFQAASRLIDVSSTLFDTLLGLRN